MKRKKLGLAVMDCFDGYPKEQVVFYPDKEAPHSVGHTSLGGMDGGGYEVIHVGMIEVDERIYSALEDIQAYRIKELFNEFFMHGFQEGQKAKALKALR